MVKKGENFFSCLIWYFNRQNCQSKEKVQEHLIRESFWRLKVQWKCVVCSDFIFYAFNLNLDDADGPVRAAIQPGSGLVINDSLTGSFPH